VRALLELTAAQESDGSSGSLAPASPNASTESDHFEYCKTHLSQALRTLFGSSVKQLTARTSAAPTEPVLQHRLSKKELK